MKTNQRIQVGRMKTIDSDFALCDTTLCNLDWNSAYAAAQGI